MNTSKIYHDSDGNECSIVQMVKREPDWCANRIQEGEKAEVDRDHWQDEAENLKIENDMLYTWKHNHEQELATATALAEKYRKERDRYLTLLRGCRLWLEENTANPHDLVEKLKKAITRIQEADK